MVVSSNIFTKDTLFHGKLVVYQYSRGYRFSIDAVILAGLTNSTSQDIVIDLGTGCAVIPLIMACRGKAKKIIGVEIQEDLVNIARRNVEENGLNQIVEIRHVDIRKVRDYFEPESFDVVVSNPPYRPVKTGRVNPETQKAIARHELLLTLSELMEASAYLLKDGGSLSIIYPAWRLDDLIITASLYYLRPKRLTCVHSSAESPAQLVHMIAKKKGGREMFIAPPLFVYETGEKRYTPQMAKFYEL
ncbi:MAG: methyltransferase [Syntrophobacterales bacterium]|nr:methyltransferase [Syntrophobacterales bacterium]